MSRPIQPNATPGSAPQAVAAPLASSPLTSAPPLPLQLLLAQAVCKLGTGANWSTISQLVESSQEWPETAAKMTQQGYESAFNDMMGSRGLDATICVQPQARPVRKLIHALYSDLLLTLRDQILSSHSQEMKLKNEIQQISSGHVDNLLFNSASQPIKDKLLENQRIRNEEEAERQRQLQTTAAEANNPVPQEPIAVPSETNVKEVNDATAATLAESEEGQEEDLNGKVAAAEEDVPMKEVEEDESKLASDEKEVGQEEGDAVEEEEEEEEEKSPKKRARKATGGRRGKRRATTGRGRAKKEVAATAEETADEEEGEGEVEEEETAEGEEEGVEGEGEVEAEDGPVAEEDGEQDEKKPSSRKRAAAPRKGSRSTKRKASEPTPPTADSPAAAADSEGTAPTNKRTKRGGRKSRADTEAEQEDTAETKESKQLAARRKTAYTRILDTIRSSLPFSSSFESKVTKSQAPNYSAAVQRSTCLRDIGKKIKSGEIKDNSELMREFAIMCANAVQFNGVEGEVSVGRQAQELWEAFEREMNQTLSTEFLTESTA